MQQLSIVSITPKVKVTGAARGEVLATPTTASIGTTSNEGTLADVRVHRKLVPYSHRRTLAL